MSKIEIDIDYVRKCSSDINNSLKKIDNIARDIKNIRQNLYSKVTYNYEITNQYNKVKNNLSGTETKIKNLKKFLECSLEDYSECENKIKKLYFQSQVSKQGKESIPNLKDIAMEIPLSASLVKDLYDQKLIFNGVEYKFKINKKKGTVSLVVKNPKQFLDKSVNSLKKNEFKDIFDNRKVNKQFVNQLANDSVVLYDSGNTKNGDKILDSTPLHEQFNMAVNKSKSKFNFAGTEEFKNSFSIKALGDGAKKEVTDRIKYFDANDWNKIIENKNFMEGLGKTASIAGDLITLGSNFKDNFYNQETGELEFKGQNIQEFTVDTAIDFGTGAATAYVGGAVGSLFFPPIGTVIGVGVGVVADCIINTPFGESEKSVVDHLKDGANWMIDELQDGMKYLGSIFW